MDTLKKPLFATLQIIFTTRRIVLLLFWIPFLFSIVFPARAEEEILSFHSDITIHEDSTMTVCEAIRVVGEGKEIKRGIYRDFPTRYMGIFGTNHIVGFELISVTRDGAPEDYHTENLFNGTRVYIGKKDVFISPGAHLYTQTD